MSASPVLISQRQFFPINDSVGALSLKTVLYARYFTVAAVHHSPHNRANMVRACGSGLVLPFAVMLVASSAVVGIFASEGVKTQVFLSPKFELGPGTVENRYYQDIPFPRGHIALKSFNGEVVDEAGNPVPLYEAYLHHWAIITYYQPKDKRLSGAPDDLLYVRNDGVCQKRVLGQIFGVGSETRKTDTSVPDPYGIEVGNPAKIPQGYEEKWMLNLHAIDTRGVEDKLGCIECRCDLYNITKDENGKPLKPGYIGGSDCCYDRTQCRKQIGFQGPTRGLYFRYTVKWVEWSESVVPVKIYIFDATDILRKAKDSTSGNSLEHTCKIEYDVLSCSEADRSANGCVDVRRSTVPLTKGGYIVYGAGHQHQGAISSTLYGEDGRVLCSSLPIYGNGTEAGNEDGYLVGISACYPPPGSVKINDGEMVTLESIYNSSQTHTGVMGHFAIYVAEQLPQTSTSPLSLYLQYVKNRWSNWL